MAREANCLWFSDVPSVYVAKTDTTGWVLNRFYPDPTLLRDLAWDGQWVWVIDAKGSISTFHPDGTLVGFIGGLLGAGWGFTYGGGPFWASDPVRHRIYKLDLPTGLEESTKSRLSIINCQLDQNRPNPFSHSTAITYHLSADGRPRTAVSLAVYDLSGRMIETLVDESLPTSYFLLPTSVVWGGKDEKGREVASGIYFYRLTAGSLVETKSMTLIRR